MENSDFYKKNLNRKLILDLFDADVVMFGSFKLKSGKISPIYINLRVLISYPSLLKRVAKEYLKLMEGLTFKRLAAIPYAAIPITGAISLLGNIPWIYLRKEMKKYGTKKRIEGKYKKGEIVILVDDLITTGLSKVESIRILESEGLKVKDVVVLIDRDEGGKEDLKKHGYRLHSVFILRDILNTLYSFKKIDDEKLKEVNKYLKNE